MACVENIPPASANAESEMEEGEIVDDLDDVSDISSEEEFLLRQRLQVLENYNNVLERKKAKRTSILPGILHKQDDKLLPDLSEISATEFEDGHTHATYKNIRVHRIKSHTKTKRKKDQLPKNKDHKKKVHRSKKRLELKIISETSEESEDEYRNKRRKLANAVVVNRVDKNDKTSLSARLKKMLCSSEPQLPEKPTIEGKQTNYENKTKDEEALSPISSINADDPIFNTEIQDKVLTHKVIEDPAKVSELIDLCTDDDVNVIDISDTHVVTDPVVDETKEQKNKESDDDIELLRQHALKTKSAKLKPVQNTRHEDENKIMSEDEDSDTAELRLICLKSALLKKAIEMKQKQKLRKRLSSVSVQSNLAESLLNDQELFSNKVDTGNNTDIESVDMDIGSDADEKTKNCSDDGLRAVNVESNAILENSENIAKDIPKIIVPKIDDLEEDEDLLRAKLLTSLSNNLVKPNILKTLDDASSMKNDIPPLRVQANKVLQAKVQNNNVPQGKLQVNNVPQKNVQVKKVPQEKPFIIQLGASDSEDEHEATKNLTKMHMKLSEQPDFQLKLDMFLKSTRMQVENSTLPDVIQEPIAPKKPEKFVAKTVKHLPKSEQIEYKNLVRRMAELEKIKQARQIPMPIENKSAVIGKETLKPRNMLTDSSKLIAINDMEEQIALSRKRIAEESSKMLKLKEEATKLSQKYKIVATELRNISTAISLNKKQQKSVHTSLSKIRLQHQKLLKSSTTSHSNVVPFVYPLNNRLITAPKLQKENDPLKDDYKNTEILKAVKVSVNNDLKDETFAPNNRLSVQVDVLSNRKVVQLPKSPDTDQLADNKVMDYNDNDCRTKIDVSQKSYVENQRDACHPVVEKGGGKRRSSGDLAAVCNIRKERCMDINDYKSPLQALDATNWKGDPNAILCPFDVSGECKDPDCKYLHTLISTQ